MKVSRFENCGSHAGYERHRRSGERACADCRSAERDRVREYRERRDAERADQIQEVADEMIADSEDEVVLVRQVVSGGHMVSVPVPVFTDPVVSARWRLRKVRAALVSAHPRDVAALARVEEETVSLLADLERRARPRGLSVLDQLAVRRAERLKDC